MALSGGGLLAGSDESDVPDLDLPPTSTRRKLFASRRPGGGRTSSPQSESICWCSPRAVLFLFLLSLVIGLGFLTVHTLRLSKELRRTTSLLAELSLLPERMKALERDVYRLRFDLELQREANPSGSSNRTATDYVVDRMDAVSRQIEAVKEDLKSLSSTLTGVDERVRELETAAGGGRRIRADPLTRSRSSPQADDVIFKRVPSS